MDYLEKKLTKVSSVIMKTLL